MRPARLLALLLLPLAASAGEARPKAEILAAFKAYVQVAPEERTAAAKPWEGLPPLSKDEAKAWRQALKDAYAQALKTPPGKGAKDAPPPQRKGEERVQAGNASMRYAIKAFGKKPAKGGWPLYINFHGGGNDRAMNDTAWSGAQGQYAVKDALLLCPRAPVDDLAVCWVAPVIYPLLDRLLKEAYLLRDVDPNRVYIMGYSMGGFGNFHLAPLMADRWAAAAASAGGGRIKHSPPFSLRNTPFMIQIGTEDHAAERFASSRAFAEALRELRAQDPGGYVLEYKEHKSQGHAINDADTPAWLSKFTRDPVPPKIALQQCKGMLVLKSSGSEDVTTMVRRFYWLQVENPAEGQKVTASREGNTITVDAEGGGAVTLYLDDRMADLDKPVRVVFAGRECFNAMVPRTLSTMVETFVDRGDVEMMAYGKIGVPPR